MGFFLILLLLFINPFFCHASIVLNEIYPASPTGENEWVELYNNENKSVDISQYQVLDEGDRKINISTGSAAPFGFVLATSVGILNNDKDTVKLKNNLGEIIDIATYSGSFSSSKTLTYLKCPDGGDHWFILDIPTKNISNEIACQTLTPIPTPVPTDTPSPTVSSPSPTPWPDYQNIFVSEVYPYPQTDEQEWIELYNNNDTQVNLEHWYIDDGENTGSAPKSFSVVIEAHSYTAVDITSSLFNNAGDAVRLLNSNKQEKDSMEYGQITEGKSMGRISFSDDFYCEQSPSKNAENTSCLTDAVKQSPTSTPRSSLSSIQKILPTNQLVNSRLIQKTTATPNNSSQIKATLSSGEILGTTVRDVPSTSPIPYLSAVSFSYSLLTIVSLFIKMRYV